MQVTNRDGKPVKGLKQEQFTVTEDGKPQKISTFEYNDIEKIETASKGEEAPITVPLGTVTSPEEIKAVVHDHRMIVLFFDLTSLQAEDLLRSTRAAQKYLQEQMTPADLVAVVAFGNTLKVIANFTNDRELLKQSVDALVPGHEAALSHWPMRRRLRTGKPPSPKIPARRSPPTIRNSTFSIRTANSPRSKRFAKSSKEFPERNP